MRAQKHPQGIMCGCFVFVITTLLSVSLAKNNNIGTFNGTIINPSFVDHEIPVFVYYPLNESNNDLYPVIVFAHGLRCESLWYSWIYKNIVPLGYIVAYINSFTGFTINQTQFAIDQRYTLKWLNTMNNNISSPLYEKIDINKSMAVGHSEGGGASIISNGNLMINNLFNNQSKFNFIFVMAPCGFQGDIINSLKNINIPIFVFTSTMDCICPHEEIEYLFNKLPETNCKLFADVTNGTHCHWLNAPIIQGIACSDIESDICKINHPHSANVTVISETTQLDIANKYLQLFINSTIMNTNNQNNFNQLIHQLQTDQKTGEMTEIKLASVCNFHF